MTSGRCIATSVLSEGCSARRGDRAGRLFAPIQQEIAYTLQDLGSTKLLNDHLLGFIAYFLVVFAIGWVSLRRTSSEEDYWIAGGNLGWFTGGATLAATHTSAGTFVGTIGVMYTAGWSFGWVVLSGGEKRDEEGFQDGS